MTAFGLFCVAGIGAGMFCHLMCDVMAGLFWMITDVVRGFR